MVFPAGSVVKNLSANAGDEGLIPGSGRCPGEENGNPFIFLPRKSQRQRRFVGHSPLGFKRVGEDSVTNQQKLQLEMNKT